MLKKITVFLLLTALLVSSIVFVEAQPNGDVQVYKVPVFLEHYYETGEPSMGNKALNPMATVVERNGRATYMIECQPMKFMKLDGQLTNLFIMEKDKDSARREALVNLHEDEAYNKTFSFSRKSSKEEIIIVAIWVDAMDSISNNGEYVPGAGEQFAKLHFDWAKAQPAAADFKVSDLTILVNQTEVFSDSAPFITNGRTMVPVRFISEALGVAIDWDDETKTVIIGSENPMRLTIGADQVIKADGSTIKLDVPAVIVEGRTMIPLRAIAELSGADVDWDGETKTVLITGK